MHTNVSNKNKTVCISEQILPVKGKKKEFQVCVKGYNDFIVTYILYYMLYFVKITLYYTIEENQYNHKINTF